MARRRKRPIDSKTDLATTTDRYWHNVFKLPATSFIRLFGKKLEDFEEIRRMVHSMGCNCDPAKIIGIDIERIDDFHFGLGVAITVHEHLGNPYQGRCYKCNLHYDTGES